tara:strand:+ start:992 stop:2380 length:1389 start_codon:yes stop_codon:yes gene_type:complete
MPEQQYAWSPQLGPQTMAITARRIIDELFFGGAAGGGKSDFLLGDFAADISQGDKWIGVLFRRHSTDMDELIHRSMQIYGPMGAEYKVGIKTWRFPGGAELRLRHMDTDADFIKYMGHSYSWIAFDELPTWDSLTPWNMMKSRLRGAATDKRMRATGNPGGRCHAEVKAYFGITKHPDGYLPMRDRKSGMVRAFIPSLVTDNQELLSVDPGYPARMMSMGDPALTRAYLDGDWNVSINAYYEAHRDDLFVEPFPIPDNWSLFAALDYGEANPTVGTLMAVDHDDDVWVVSSYYSRGAGAEHAAGIKAMVKTCPWTRGDRRVEGRSPRLILAPSDMWTKRSPGEATQARSAADTFTEAGLYLTRANMDRVNGWRNVGNLLLNGRLKFFKGYADPILESLLSVQRDPRNPEDVNKGGDDHGADSLRYGINHVYKPRRIAKTLKTDGSRLIDQMMTTGATKERYE